MGILDTLENWIFFIWLFWQIYTANVQFSETVPFILIPEYGQSNAP